MTTKKLTPMQAVRKVYPTSKAVQVDNGWHIVNFVGNDRYSLSGVRKTASLAWGDAEKTMDAPKKEKFMTPKGGKLSKRRQRIINKIETGEYIPKTAEQSLNIAFRRYGV